MQDRSDEEFAVSRGRRAHGPGQLPLLGWKDVVWRIYASVGDNRIMLVAAGATFYLLLALFPALAAFVSLYGLVADPGSIAEHIAFVERFLPPGVFDIIKSQLESLASQDANALSVGFIIGLCVALWSANNGIKTLFDAMNIVYNEREKRGFVALNALSGLFTLGAIVAAIVLITSVGVVPAIIKFMRLGEMTETLLNLLRWPVLLIVIALGICLIYRYGPSRRKAQWRWLAPGAIVATLIWLAASAAFSYYLQNFADYNATYGSLGAAIGFLMWTWISVLILLLGAQFNAEIEHQTTNDTTAGRERSMGQREAYVADHVGREAPGR